MPSFLAQWLRLLVYQGTGLGIAAATVAVAAMAVPPAEYGQYGLMLSMVQIASGVGLLWIQAGLLRYGREEFRASGRADDTVAAALVLAGCVLAVVLASGWLVGPWLKLRLGLPDGFLAVVMSCLVVFAAFELASYAAQARGRFDGYAGGQIIARSGALLGMLVLLAGYGGGATFLMASAGLGWALAAAWTARSACAGGFRPSAGWPRQVRPLVAYGHLLPVSVAASLLSQWMGLWIVRAQIGLAEAGVLLWAMGLYSLIAGITQPLGAILAPRMIDLRLGGDDRELRYRIDLILAAGLLLATLFPVVLVATKLTADAFLPATYAGATPILVSLLSVFPAMLVGSALSPLIGANENMIRRTVALNVVACGLSICCLLVLVPRVGTMGAAGAMMLTSVTISFGNLILARQCLAPSARPGMSGILGRQALNSAMPAAIGAGALLAGGAAALLAAAAASAVCVLAGRRLGALHHLAALRPHAERSVVARLPFLLRLLDWISDGRAYRRSHLRSGDGADS